MGGHHHAEENIKLAFFLNLGFTVIEIIGGLYTNSLAILSDALHDLGDSMSLGLSWYFQKLSKKGRTERFSYGYKRFTLLSVIINSIVLLVGSIFILARAIPVLISPREVDTEGMLYFAILGVVVNGAAVYKLRKGHTLNERAVLLHLLEDVLGWVAVLIGSVVMMFYDLPIIDPILSILISLFVIYNVMKNLFKSFSVILQAIPVDVDMKNIREKLVAIDSILTVHDCHIWSLDGEYNVLTIHLVMDDNYALEELNETKRQVRTILKDEAIQHITIEFESKDEDCYLNDC